ncbi:MAG: hypothetical protein HC882_03650 [Acidobacteria bacterium]|nr:hypothetical protein [Acidobacteriota bacterium]
MRSSLSRFSLVLLTMIAAAITPASALSTVQIDQRYQTCLAQRNQVADECGISAHCLSTKLPGINSSYLDCVRSVVAGSLAFGFTYVEGAGLPSTVIYRFARPEQMTGQVKLTVFNAGEDPTRLSDATVWLSGFQIASAADFLPAVDFDTDVFLVAGTNELRIDAASGEVGAITIALSTPELSPPNPMP